MSQKDSSSKIKAQQGGTPSPARKAGNTKYKMQAAQLAQEAAKITAEQEAQANAQAASQSEDTVRGLWKSRVLASYKGKGSKDSNTLLAKISDGKASLEVGDHYKSVNIQEVMVHTVDKMFDIFQNCAYEFNKVAAGSELEVNWIRPFLSKEVTNSWHQQENANLIFSGRVSTRRWTMVIKGTTEEVAVFILPADKLIGFALSHNNFKPYFTMTPISDTLDVHWRIEEHNMPPELFPTIYKELFDGLIRFAREEARLDETFTLRQIGIVPAVEPEKEAEEDQARQKFYQEQFFQDMHSRDHDFKPAEPVPDFAKPEAHNAAVSSGGWKQVPDINVHNADAARALAERSAASLRQHTPAMAPQLPVHQVPPQPHTPPAMPPPMPPQMPHQPQAPQMPQQMQQMPHQPQAPQMQPQMPHQPQAPHMQPQMPHQPQAPHMQPPMPHQAQAPQMPTPMPLHMPQMQPQWPALQPQNPPQPQAQQQSQQPQRAPQAPPPQYQQQQPQRPANFTEALSALLSCLDQELEIVARAGSDAFAQRDLARADAALKFSGRLTEFRTLARELYEYYGGGKA